MMSLPLLKPIILGSLTLIQVENPSPSDSDLHFLFLLFEVFINLYVSDLPKISREINYEI